MKNFVFGGTHAGRKICRYCRNFVKIVDVHSSGTLSHIVKAFVR